MTEEARAGQDLLATFEFTLGSVVVKLLSKDAPRTVENFVGLATGEKPWTHPGTLELMRNTPLYDGTILHRCIPNFMVQGGDPTGTGRGNPGFKFEDELQAGRRFDRPGLLAMANSGPNTNGCQFFITVASTAWLNGKHTIFGEVVSGQDIIDRIANVVPKGPGDRPRTDVVLKKLSIVKPQ